MPEQLEEIANQILAQLKKLERPVAQFLQDGLNRDEITAKLSSIELPDSPDLQRLYTWRNGTHVVEGVILDDLHFFPGFYLMSLDDAVQQYGAIKNDTRWNKSWLPIFANGGGDFYAIDLSHMEGTSYSIIGFVLGEPEHPIEYQGLREMFSTLRDCFEQNIFMKTNDGYLEMDDLRHAIVARKNNPQVAFWAAN